MIVFCIIYGNEINCLLFCLLLITGLRCNCRPICFFDIYVYIRCILFYIAYFIYVCPIHRVLALNSGSLFPSSETRARLQLGVHVILCDKQSRACELELRHQWRCVHRGRKGAAPPRIFRKNKWKKRSKIWYTKLFK